MEPMFLPEVEAATSGPIEALRGAFAPVPQILHLFAFRPDRNDALARFTQGVMRGPSDLSPGLRELIAAFTSRKNQCPF